jgi:hypothetical protein
VIGALGLGIFWLATTGNEPDRPIASSGGAGDGPKAAGDDAAHAKAPNGVATPPPADDGTPAADAGAIDSGPGEDSDAVVAPDDDDDGDAGEDDGAVAIEDAGVEDDPPEKPTSTKPRPKQPKPVVKKDPKEPKPPPPPSGPTAEEYLDEAVKKSFSSPSEAYTLAKKSYEQKRTQKALSLMCSSACKMGDTGKAQNAYSKLRGQLKVDAQSFCAKKGINL